MRCIRWGRNSTKGLKMNCPFCHKQLVKDPDGCYTCYADNCAVMSAGGNGASGSLSLWLKLIQMRNALELAVDVLKEIDELLSKNKFDIKEVPLLNITQAKISMLLKCINI